MQQRFFIADLIADPQTETTKLYRAKKTYQVHPHTVHTTLDAPDNKPR